LEKLSSDSLRAMADTQKEMSQVNSRTTYVQDRLRKRGGSALGETVGANKKNVMRIRNQIYEGFLKFILRR
jgi:hypothetical protein